jgi:hypothetical protein
MRTPEKPRKTPIFRHLRVSVMTGGKRKHTAMNQSGGRHGQIWTGLRRFFSNFSFTYVTHLRPAT